MNKNHQQQNTWKTRNPAGENTKMQHKLLTIGVALIKTVSALGHRVLKPDVDNQIPRNILLPKSELIDLL